MDIVLTKFELIDLKEWKNCPSHDYVSQDIVQFCRNNLLDLVKYLRCNYLLVRSLLLLIEASTETLTVPVT